MGLGASAVNITEQQEQLDDEQEGDSAYFEAYEASGEDHEGLQEGSEFDPSPLCKKRSKFWPLN